MFCSVTMFYINKTISNHYKRSSIQSILLVVSLTCIHSGLRWKSHFMGFHAWDFLFSEQWALVGLVTVRGLPSRITF